MRGTHPGFAEKLGEAIDRVGPGFLVGVIALSWVALNLGYVIGALPWAVYFAALAIAEHGKTTTKSRTQLTLTPRQLWIGPKESASRYELLHLRHVRYDRNCLTIAFQQHTIEVPIDGESVDATVWVGQAIEAAARQALDDAGDARDVPTGLRGLGARERS